MDIEPGYRAFCLDEAVAAWGNYVSSELEKISGKTDKEVNKKRTNKLLQLLDAPAEKRFRSLRNSPQAKK